MSARRNTPRASPASRVRAVLAAGLLGASGAADGVDFVYEPPRPLPEDGVPGLALRTPDCSALTALRVGGRPDDTLYLFHDCAREYAYHDAIFVYIPTQTPRAIRLAGSGRGPERRYARVRFQGAFGPTRLDYEMDLVVRTDWQDREVEVDASIMCDVRDTTQRARLHLLGGLPAVMGANRQVKPLPLLANPILKLGWDRRYSPPKLKGHFAIGDLKMIPGAGMPGHAVLTLSDADGQPVGEEVHFRPEPSLETGIFVCRTSRSLRALTPYLAKVTVDLAPVFAPVTGVDGLVIDAP